LIDILSLDHFIDALTDSEIKLRLRVAIPTNLNAAKTRAVRLQSYRLADSQRTKSFRIAEIDKGSSSSIE
jgi:5-carboxymethyl-2-hydroxymuconate isomerase